jgi:hypothetical protein
VWNQRHLIIVLREYEDFCNTHRRDLERPAARITRGVPALRSATARRARDLSPRTLPASVTPATRCQ